MDGFMVVRVVSSGRMVSVPVTWIFDIKRHWEKFTNYAINTSQEFLCYWPNHVAAFENFGTRNEKPNAVNR